MSIFPDFSPRDCYRLGRHFHHKKYLFIPPNLLTSSMFIRTPHFAFSLLIPRSSSLHRPPTTLCVASHPRLPFRRSRLSCNRCLVFSSSSFRLVSRLFPARLMKNCTIRIAEPSPFGLTFLVAITRAIVSASFLYKPSGGYVETVLTLPLQRRSAPLRCDFDLAEDDFPLRVDFFAVAIVCSPLCPLLLRCHTSYASCKARARFPPRIARPARTLRRMPITGATKFPSCLPPSFLV